MSLQMSMVALPEQGEISLGAISAAWAKRWPESPQPTEVTQEDCIYSYNVGDHAVICGLMQAPMPTESVDLAGQNAVFWPEAVEAMREQRRHVIVTVSGAGDPVQRMHILTQATIALLDACPAAIGVMWCSSNRLLSASKFTDIACLSTPAEPVLPIWVSIFLISNDDGSNAGFTRGLGAFDLMDFEVLKTSEPPVELHKRLLGLAAYVIDNGPVIQDGDTIGENVNERIKVIYSPPVFEGYSPSLHGPDRQVMRLDYDGGQSAGLTVTTYGCIHGIATILCTLAFGYFLYSVFPYLRDSYVRHVILIPLVFIFGFFLLIISDIIFRVLFGWEAFYKPKS
jgi:hypothetical protein